MRYDITLLINDTGADFVYALSPETRQMLATAGLQLPPTNVISITCPSGETDYESPYHVEKRPLVAEILTGLPPAQLGDIRVDNPRGPRAMSETLDTIRGLCHKNLIPEAVTLVDSLQGEARKVAAAYLRDRVPDLAQSIHCHDQRAVLARVRPPQKPGDPLRWWPLGECEAVEFLPVAPDAAPEDVLLGRPLSPTRFKGTWCIFTEIPPEDLRTMLERIQNLEGQPLMPTRWRAAVLRMALDHAPNGANGATLP